jgi:putative nucleotidyltransferase with HDIG domain
MPNGFRRKKRTERATLALPPGAMQRTLYMLRRGDVLLRLAICIVSGVAIWALTAAWAPPFSYRSGYTPPRDVVARLDFPNPTATLEAREAAKRQVRYIYRQDPAPLVQLRGTLSRRVRELAQQPALAGAPAELVREFRPPAPSPGPAAPQQSPPTPPPGPAPDDLAARFERLRTALDTEDELRRFDEGIASAFEPFERSGIMDEFRQDPTAGDPAGIVVYQTGKPADKHAVSISDVLIGDGSDPLTVMPKLQGAIKAQLEEPVVADFAIAWLQNQRLPNTLTVDTAATDAEREQAASAIPEVIFAKGETLAKAGEPLDDDAIRVVRWEHAAYIAGLRWESKVYRSLAAFGLLITLYSLCGYYVLHHERRMVLDLGRLLTTLTLVVLTVGMARWMSGDPWRGELIPLLLCGTTIALAYQQELALLVTLAVSLVLALTTVQSLGEFIILTGVAASAVVQLRRVRSRSKLISVGFICGLIACLLTLVVGLLEGQPLNSVLLSDAGRNFIWALASGFLMTGLLPFIERFFGVVTEISLLELGDVAHPLLQELVRRAPGTYNHSINVASIAEAAAEAIGAKGLLVRVGAYFHDIGKMFKPGYFTENMGDSANRHETLVPAMSTLIIIAHVKDGADLARQHRLPPPIIDFIEQHHGTTLVEYFFHRANMQHAANPDTAEVEESSFRYPGPKPQTKEACVLMLADAVEGACRALVEPTPSRIEGVVHDIAMKRLLDGQFDESGLTLQELRIVQDSLVKSLTAVYHGRVKYPDQRTA